MKLSRRFKLSLLVSVFYLVTATLVLFVHLYRVGAHPDEKIDVWLFHFNMVSYLNLHFDNAYQMYVFIWLGEVVNALAIFGLLYISTTLLFSIVTFIQSGYRH